MTRLEKTLRRELAIAGKPHTLSVSPEGFRLVEKGRRKGIDIAWKDLLSGDAGLAAALQASLSVD